MKLDWGSWVYGLFAALIGGGAAAVTAAFSAIVLTPGQYGVSGDGAWNSLKLMGLTFIISGLIATFAYLKQSPLPAVEPDVTTTSVATTTQPGVETATTKTISQTHTEPKP